MKKMYKYIIIVSVIAIAITILTVFNNRSTNNIMFIYELIGDYNISNGCINIENKQSVNFIKDIGDIRDSTIFTAYNAVDYILEIREKNEVMEDENSTYLLVSVGSRIKEADVACKLDKDMSGSKDSPFLVTVEYEEEYNAEKLYIYKVTSNENTFQFSNVYKIVETYGNDDGVRLVQTYNNSIDMLFYRAGVPVPIPSKEKEGYAHDPVVESNINYYYFNEPYLYTINRWGRYIVVNVNNYKVLVRTEDYDSIPLKHKNIFENIDMFFDISYLNNEIIYNTVQIEDSSLVLKLKEFDSEKNVIYLCDIKNRLTIHYIPNIINKPLNYIKLENKKLYAIDVYGTYYIVDIESGDILFADEDIKNIQYEYKEVFSDLGTFYASDDIVDIIKSDVKYIE